MTRDELAAAGFEVGPAAHARLSRFVELLLRENRRVNLTAIRTSEDVWRLHVCESLALLPLISGLRPRRLLDLGTGGGIPGIPLACVCKGLDVTLLDATRKKLEAVARIVSGLGLQRVRTLWGRAETLAHDAAYRETFDVVTARAVAALPALVEYAAGFVRPGGQCWFAKPPEAATRELKVAQRAAGQCGLTHVDTHQFTL
ncbi:MAG: 16S rRNA (guanine(527)-N(7))-methyltransferase RsmG, partial [Phycisphaerae bacterium]